MASWQQIVIGRGTSALTFLHAAFHGTQKSRFVHNETLIIGKPERQLWAKVARYDGSHQMGQPAHLLRPSGLTPTLSRGEQGEFIETVQYNQMLDKLWDKTLKDRDAERPPLYVLDANATEVHAEGGWYRVVTDVGGEHSARQVIIAGGPGPSQTLAALRVPIVGKVSEGEIAASGEYIDSIEYMTKAQRRLMKVMVYGGSASSSWAVAHAFAMQAYSILWGCRRGLTSIETEGNPIGRNSETIARAKSANMIFACEIEKVEVLDGQAEFTGRLRVHFKEGTGPNGKPFMDFDQLVYSVGADPVEALGPGGILKGALKDRIVPVWDHNYRFSQPGERNAITALKDGAGDLWVVGAAVFRGLGVKTVKDMLNEGSTNFYAKVGEILCAGGRPPEGIAIIDSTINALTGYRQTDSATFNWNKANQRDIFQLLAKIYQIEIPLSVREEIVRQVINRRKATASGITQQQLVALMTEMKRTHDLKIDLGLLPNVASS